MLQWWSGYQDFPGLNASHEHADAWAPASERSTKLQNERNTSLQNCAAATGQLPLETILKIKQWSRKQIASIEQSLFAPVFTGSSLEIAYQIYINRASNKLMTHDRSKRK